jgi:hypothetical protein
MKPFQSSRHFRKGLTRNKVEIISDLDAAAKEAAATSKLGELLQKKRTPSAARQHLERAKRPAGSDGESEADGV